MVNHYRWDFIGLSTDTKPTPETSEKVVDGSTFYCSDTSKLYVYCKDDWYEKVVSGGGTTYTAGDNITIENNVISATDTTYNNFTGTDGETAGASGLVPAPATTDAGKFLKADGTWDTAGGSSVNVVQTRGNSQTDVMSQDATTSLIYHDPSIRKVIGIGEEQTYGLGAEGQVIIGYKAKSGDGSERTVVIGRAGEVKSGSSNAIAIGYLSKCDVNTEYSVAIGTGATVKYKYCVALGSSSGSLINSQGIVDISTANGAGYSGSIYRLLKGLYDGQDLHDSATVAQGNTLATSAPTTSTVGVLGQLYTDTTNMHTYQCTAIDTTDPDNPAYTWTQRW